MPKFEKQFTMFTVFPVGRYNHETHEIVGMCKKLEEVFEAKFKNCPTDDPLDAHPQTSAAGSAGLLVHHMPTPKVLKTFLVFVFFCQVH
jgi:hypothetical protein